VAVASPRSTNRVLLLGLGALTVLAFALRVVGMDQSLYNDERLTHAIVTEHGLRGAIREVYETSVTPPLHYVLAWFSVQLPGDDTVLVRLPSLIFGTANVPLLFLLGRRVGGVRVGLLAAMLMALSPFAIYFSNEARTYEVMVFLVALSTLALLSAVERGDRRWWLVYAVSSCGAIWAHYTAVFVLAAGAVWTAWAHRERLRELAVAVGAIGVGYLPWVPGYVNQRQAEALETMNQLATNSFGEVFESPLRTLIGHQFIGLEEVPGGIGLLVLLALVVLVLATAVYRPSALRQLMPPLRSARGLMLILALATPVGLLLYDVVGPALYAPRNLSASQPALIVVVALLLDYLATTGPARVALPAIACLFAALALVAFESLEDDKRRPPYRDAARYLDAVAGRSPVIDLPPVLGADITVGRSLLEQYFDREHRVYPLLASADAWRHWRSGGRVYFVSTKQEGVDRTFGLDRAPPDLLARQARLGGPDGRAVVRGRKTFAGFEPVTVRWFQGAVDGRLEQRGGRETISWSLGRHVAVSPGVAVGRVEKMSEPEAPMLVSGWALEANRSRPVDWVLAFSGSRLLAVSPGGGERPDIAASRGESALLSGFSFWSFDPPPDDSTIRVFGVVDDQASELRTSGVEPASAP
jgi:4-amino-4-deoxy-L-arabinose transferase-like glycosyltransferase